jgi:hypothetical protein
MVQRGGGYISLLQNVQTGSGAHPTSHSMGTGFFPGVKRPEREFDHSPPSNAGFKHMWSYNSIPPIRLYGVERDKFTCTF